MKSLQEVIVENFKRIAEKRGLDQREVAKKGGMSEGQLSKILTKEHAPSLSSLGKIVKGLEIEAWELFVDYDNGQVGPLSVKLQSLISDMRRASENPEGEAMCKPIYDLAKNLANAAKRTKI